MNPLNFSTISFPTFGIEVNPPRYLQLGPLTVYFYGIIIGLGLLLAVSYCCKRSKQFGLTEDNVLDGLILVLPIAIACARAYYCAFAWDEFKDNPISVLYIWNGGIAIYGGVLGAVFGMWIFSRWKKLKLAAVLDLILLGFLIGQSIGRWGNFMNREAFGAETDSFLRMGLYNAITGQTIYVHPTFLYESVWNAVGFVILHFASRKRRYDGQVALWYAAWYGMGRTLIEGLRVDSLYWGPFRVSQCLAAFSCAAAVAVLIYNAMRPHDPANMLVNQVAANKVAPEQTEATEE